MHNQGRYTTKKRCLPILWVWLATLSFSLSFFPAHARSSEFTLDIDGDGETAALTDGLLIMRHLFDFKGDALTDAAVGSEATRSDPQEIQNYLSEYSSQLDIDDDGSTEALTDGLLIMRTLFDFSESALINSAVGSLGNRKTATEIATYIDTLRDSDNDGVVDGSDALPFDITETRDDDLDGIGNNADLDDDGDGVSDVDDAYPLISLGGLVDSDQDGIPNDCNSACIKIGMAADGDDDNDGISDDADFAPTDPLRPISLNWDGGNWGEDKWY